jgi:hypothetical protein
VSLALIAIAGMAMVVRPWFVFSRFHAEYLIAWSVGFEITREWGAWGAALVACFHVTAFHHAKGVMPLVPDVHAGPDTRSRWPRMRSAAIAACSVPTLYLPVALLALGSAMLTARVALGLAPGAFFYLLKAEDVGFGFIASIVLGVVPFAWTFAGAKLFSSERRGLGFKLFATWLCMLGTSAVFSVVLWAVQPAEQPSELLFSAPSASP